jgi:hemolysin activation/secretion protein
MNRSAILKLARIVPGKAAILLLLIAFMTCGIMRAMAADEEETHFEIKGFMVAGNTLLPDKPLDDDPKSPFRSSPTIQTELETYIGPDKTADDIEKARAALENTYHRLGYPTVLVNIPEQTLTDGMVRLEVIESTIRRVRVTGNNYYTMENIKKELPSVQEGKVLNLPHLQDELLNANRNPDLRVEPALSPGKDFGTVDVDLKVKDEIPFHGSLEVNNRNSPGTTDLRLNGLLRYDNLWQKDHSVSLQYQMSPQKPSEVEVVAGSYVLPNPLHEDHRIVFYSVWSDSNSAFGEGFQMQGKGYVLGTRYVMPLAPYELYTHNVSVGVDYKHFAETSTFYDQNLKTPITYLPLNLTYNSSLAGDSGTTNFNSALNMSFRGLVSDQEQFEVKRFRANANYIYLTAGLDREQKLPWNTSLFVKVDGQLADQPLISNEQYMAGGMKSVRGYQESSSAGDNAIHSTVELSGPNLAEYMPFSPSYKFESRPFIFYDIAYLSIMDPLTGQADSYNLQGTGVGLRGLITAYVDYELDLAWALKAKDTVSVGDMMLYFLVKSHF